MSHHPTFTEKLKQRLAFLAFRSFQKRQPESVEVLGQTYRTDGGVFNPRFYLTSGFMARHIDVPEGASVLDMGCGSGVQAVTAAAAGGSVVAVDVNFAAAAKTRENADLNGVGERVLAIQGDLFGPLRRRPVFDVIIFTPPYMEGTPGNDLERAWFDPGKALVTRFFEEAGHYLKKGRYVQMVYSSLAENLRVLEIAESSGWTAAIMARRRSILETFYIYRFTRKTPEINSSTTE